MTIDVITTTSLTESAAGDCIEYFLAATTPPDCRLSTQDVADDQLCCWLEDWQDVLRASLDTSFAFLADEPDLYTDEDGEPL